MHVRTHTFDAPDAPLPIQAGHTVETLRTDGVRTGSTGTVEAVRPDASQPYALVRFDEGVKRIPLAFLSHA